MFMSMGTSKTGMHPNHIKRWPVFTLKKVVPVLKHPKYFWKIKTLLIPSSKHKALPGEWCHSVIQHCEWLLNPSHCQILRSVLQPLWTAQTWEYIKTTTFGIQAFGNQPINQLSNHYWYEGMSETHEKWTCEILNKKAV